MNHSTPSQSSSAAKSADADLYLAADQIDASAGNPTRRLRSLLRGRYHWAILLAIILGAGAATAGYFGPTPQYTGVGQVEIRPTEDTLMYHMPDKGVPPMFHDWLDTQIAKFTSPSVLSSAMASDDWIQAGLSDMTQQQFASHLNIDRSTGYLLSVSFTSSNPRAAAAGVNAVMDAFRASYKDASNQKEAHYIQMLQSRQNRLQNQLQALTSQKTALAQSLHIQSIDERYQFELQQMQTLEESMRQTKLQIASLTAPPVNTYKDVTIAQLSTTDPYMRQLFQQKDQFQADMDAKQAMGVGVNNLQLLRDRVAIQHLNEQIQSYAQAIRTGQVTPATVAPGKTLSLPALEQRQSQLKQMHEQLQARLATLGSMHEKTQVIDNQITRINQQLADTSLELAKRDVESKINDRVKISRYAVAPTSPSNDSKRHKLAALGGIAGISLGIALVALVGLMDHRLRHVDDAQPDGAPKRPMLGVLPTLPANLADPDQAQLAALSVHHIRTLLQLKRGGDQPARVFSITSPAAGSGKSSLSIALGLSFAASRARTLLIDCDLVGAGLTRRLQAVAHPPLAIGLRQSGALSEDEIHDVEHHQRPGETFADAALRMGLVDHLRLDEVRQGCDKRSIGILDACAGQRLQDCIVRAGTNDLHVLPVGEAQPNDAGELSPASLHRLIDQAREQFDTILIDSGPILGSIEASMAASEADAVIFIVSRGDQKAFAHHALSALEAIDARIAGIVFNHALAGDVRRSSYTSAGLPRSSRSSGFSRSGSGGGVLVSPSVDRATSERLGPLASAMISCGSAPP